MNRTILTVPIVLLLLLGLLPMGAAQIPEVLSPAPSYEALPNGGLEGDVNETGVGDHFTLAYDGSEVYLRDQRSGAQSVNLAKAGAEPQSWSALGQLALRPAAGTPFSSWKDFTYFVKMPRAPAGSANVQAYISLDAGNDGDRDFCIVVGARPLAAGDAWIRFSVNRSTPVMEGGPDCAFGPVGAGAPTLGQLQLLPSHATAVVRAVHLQSISQPGAWPADTPILVDDASLFVDEAVAVGPLGYHAQFSFDPPLEIDEDGAETFLFQSGRVLVTVRLFDATGGPKDFRAGSAPPARLVLSGTNASSDGSADILSLPGLVGPARNDEALFLLHARDLLHLAEDVTAWEIRVESPNEPGPSTSFPAAYAYYNARANATFAQSAALADALDGGPSDVAAVLIPVAVKVLGAPTADIIRLTYFMLEAAVVDEADRVIAHKAFNLSVSRVAGPGPLAGTLNATTVDGIAAFNDLRFDTIGLYRLRVDAESLGLVFQMPLLNVVGAPKPPTEIEPGATLRLEYVLPSDATSAYVLILDAETLQVIGNATLVRSVGDDGRTLWTGSITLQNAGEYITRIVYETEQGPNVVPGDPITVRPKHATPGPLAGLTVLALVVGFVWARRRKA